MAWSTRGSSPSMAWAIRRRPAVLRDAVHPGRQPRRRSRDSTPTRPGSDDPGGPLCTAEAACAGFSTSATRWTMPTAAACCTATKPDNSWSAVRRDAGRRLGARRGRPAVLLAHSSRGRSRPLIPSTSAMASGLSPAQSWGTPLGHPGSNASRSTCSTGAAGRAVRTLTIARPLSGFCANRAGRRSEMIGGDFGDRPGPRPAERRSEHLRGTT